jgi:hypothetical protein
MNNELPLMNEQLLQFIWQFGYFNGTSLCTVANEPLQIIHKGTFNTNQGPDFINAKIRIDSTLLAGTIEVHVKSSDWKKHRHTGDRNYKNVVLHVVYENDEKESEIPVLELHSRIAKTVLTKYASLMSSQAFIPCETMMQNVPEITLSLWKDRLVAERLIRKAKIVEDYLLQNKQHWEESFWWLLARNFGTKINADAFEAVAKSIPVNILAKHKNQLQQLEALLLGQAGLLQENFEDAYTILLQKEYKFLSTKYKLKPVHIPVHFLRMRPVNFPTIRLAQLAALVQNSVHLFSKILEEPLLRNVRKWFQVEANDFWHYHYTLNETSAYKKKVIGADMVENILINTIAPVLFAYGTLHQEQQIKDKAIRWLEEAKAEKNSITKGFQALGLPLLSAMDSQAFIELKTQYCNHKRCLNCAVGTKLLR